MQGVFLSLGSSSDPWGWGRGWGRGVGAGGSGGEGVGMVWTEWTVLCLFGFVAVFVVIYCYFGEELKGIEKLVCCTYCNPS